MTRRLVLDANILIRASFGSRVSTQILRAQQSVDLFTPEICLRDAERHMAQIAARRAIPIELPLRALTAAMRCIDLLDEDFTSAHRSLSVKLLRDGDDWPVLAAALALGATIWSEDQDFFGTGIPNIVCHNLELWLSSPQFGAIV